MKLTVSLLKFHFERMKSILEVDFFVDSFRASFFFKYNNFVKIKWNFKYIKKYDIKIPFLFYKNAKNLRTIFEN